MIIGVMGPEGSYSEKAAKLWTAKYKLCGAEFRYFADIEDTLLAAVQGKSDLSVIPVENSIEGSVGVTLDLLLEKNVRIVGEVVVKIEHCLLAKGRLDEIRIILSHPQGLAQCRHFLKKHFPGTELRSTGSTSHAARLAGEFEEMAAIASPEAAECYRLKYSAFEYSGPERKLYTFHCFGSSGERPEFWRERPSYSSFAFRNRFLKV